MGGSVALVFRRVDTGVERDALLILGIGPRLLEASGLRDFGARELWLGPIYHY